MYGSVMTDTTYRVRDVNTTDQKGTIWGENLAEKAAALLKEKVVGAGKSRTARVEPMSADPNAIGEPTDQKLQHARDIGYVVNTAKPHDPGPAVRRPQAPVAGRPVAPFNTGSRPVDPNAAKAAATAAARGPAQNAQARADKAANKNEPTINSAELPDFDETDLDGDDGGDHPDVNLDELHVDPVASGTDHAQT